MELLTTTLAANETKQFAKAGRYFEIIDSTYAVNVAFNAANGAQSDQMVGALSGLYLEDPYSHFSITNGAVAQSITLLVMETGRGGSRRQPGNVRVIDQSIDKTRAGLQFMNSSAAAANPGALSLVGIHNLAANARTVSLKKVIVSSATAGFLYFIKGSSPGTTYGANQAAGNKFVTGPVSSARIFQGNTAALNPTGAEVPGAYLWVAFYVPANTPFLFPLEVPVVLSPNDIFYVSSGVINRDVSGVFDFEEVA